MSSKENKEKFWKIISKIKTGMLTTTTPEGKLHSRPMQLVQDDYDGTLWFFTGMPSDKTTEVEQGSSVCVTFSDDDRYVALYGEGHLTRDQKKIDELWNPMVSAWFPEGKESQRCALIEIKINHGELWDGDINPAEFIYEMGKAKIKNERPDIGEHRQF